MSIAGSFSLGIVESPPGLPASPALGILGCSTLALAAVRQLRVLRRLWVDGISFVSKLGIAQWLVPSGND